MTLRLPLALALVAGVTALGGAALAEERCYHPFATHYPYVCRDPEYRTCLAYGSLGEEAWYYTVGTGCPWPYGGS